MDRSYPYTRRRVSRARMRKRIAAVAAAVVAGGALWSMLAAPHAGSPATAGGALEQMAGTAARDAGGSRGLRRFYPYSVVPGGVSGPRELARVIRTDSVVAAHYATFDVSKARAVTVAEPRAVHVSYRKNGKVYWTAHKVMLAAGETLLTDGRSEMRARCANRISDVAQYPVEAHAPRMEELDQGVDSYSAGYSVGPDGMPLEPGDDGGLLAQASMLAPGRVGSPGPGVFGSGQNAKSPQARKSASGNGADSLRTMSSASYGGSLGSFGNRPQSGGRPATPVDDGAAAGGDGSQSPGTGTSPPGSAGGSGSAGGGSEGAGAGDGGSTTQPPSGGSQGANPGGTGGADDGGIIPVPGANPGGAQDPILVPGDDSSSDGGDSPLFPSPGTDNGPFIPPPVITPQPQPGGQHEGEDPAHVPEPGSAWLFALALPALLGLRRRPQARPRA